MSYKGSFRPGGVVAFPIRIREPDSGVLKTPTALTWTFTAGGQLISNGDLSSLSSTGTGVYQFNQTVPNTVAAGSKLSIDVVATVQQTSGTPVTDSVTFTGDVELALSSQNVPTVNQIVAAMFEHNLYGAPFKRWVRIMGAMLAGTLTRGGGGTSGTIRGLFSRSTLNEVTMTTTAEGDRLTATYDATETGAAP